MRLAYADPPYPGQSKRHYSDHPDYAGEVDHAALVAQLEGYDGWALSTSMVGLRDVLPLCPPGSLVAVWHVTNAEPPGFRKHWNWYLWEPVILSPARRSPRVRNVLATFAPTGHLGNTITGEKPPAFCDWVFRLLGADQDDELDDLFPGSGAVGRAWERFSRQLALVV